jgi:hypothetical protein
LLDFAVIRKAEVDADWRTIKGDVFKLNVNVIFRFPGKIDQLKRLGYRPRQPSRPVSCEVFRIKVLALAAAKMSSVLVVKVQKLRQIAGSARIQPIHSHRKGVEGTPCHQQTLANIARRRTGHLGIAASSRNGQGPIGPIAKLISPATRKSTDFSQRLPEGGFNYCMRVWLTGAFARVKDRERKMRVARQQFREPLQVYPV